MAKRNIDGLRTIVTGASSGIGREVALELGRRGAQLVVTARRSDQLETLAAELHAIGAAAVSITGDIVEPATRGQLFAAASSEFGGLDAVINNAGIGALGPFAAADEARLRRVMEVNFFAAAELTRAAVPLLRKSNRAIIVNVSSVLGHFAVPNKSEYCASKFALHGLSDALRCELKADRIDVLLVSPSTTASEFFEHVMGKQTSGAAKRGMSPQTVARKTVNAIRRGKHEIILSGGGKSLVWLDRLCPPLADWLMARFAP